MSEKVKLPKAVCDALDDVRNHMTNYSDVIMHALVLGYEPIPDTPEEMMKDIWFRHSSDGYLHKTIRQCICLTLKIHEIHYDWLKDDAE